MPIDVIMPPLSQTLDTVILAKWLKSVGQPVAKGEPLFSIETDKATLEIESPGSGILQQILAPEKSEVALRSRVGVIALAGEALAAVAPAGGAPEQDAVSPSRAMSAPLSAPDAGQADSQLSPSRRARIFASPRARRLAEQEGVPLTSLAPTGPQNTIVERDVRAYLGAAGKAAPLTASIAPRAIQEWQHPAGAATFLREADVTELLHLCQQIMAAAPAGAPRLTHTDILVSIVARQLTYPSPLNALSDGENVQLSRPVHITMTLATGAGLLRFVLRDADRKRPLELARERERLAQRASAGQLGPEELSGGSFTVADLGYMGMDAFTPGLTPPQVAILGAGRIRPAPYAGAAAGRQLMSLALTFDRRFVDDAPAARFLAGVVEWIEHPYLML